MVTLHKMRSLFKDKMKTSLVLKGSIFTQETQRIIQNAHIQSQTSFTFSETPGLLHHLFLYLFLLRFKINRWQPKRFKEYRTKAATEMCWLLIIPAFPWRRRKKNLILLKWLSMWWEDILSFSTCSDQALLGAQQLSSEQGFCQDAAALTLSSQKSSIHSSTPARNQTWTLHI